MRLSDFDYHLPPELIAQQPMEPRDASRLLVLRKGDGLMAHRHFRDIVKYLNANDILLLNRTRVFPARLLGRKKSGGRVELLLLRPEGDGLWRCLCQPGRRLGPGVRLEFGEGLLAAEVVERLASGQRLVKFYQEDLFSILERIGHVPLPPYIKRTDSESDRLGYQTVYAREPGSVAAPTAGLHFTRELLEIIKSRGVQVLEIVLHVGLGTFKPVEVSDISQHKMEEEYYHLEPEAAEVIAGARERGKRIVAVGTTTVRALESFAVTQKTQGWTDIFIHPPYEFRLVDALVTNFHLPRSTLIMLVSALAGLENIQRAYAEAVACRYRFYSYGDAMLII